MTQIWGKARPFIEHHFGLFLVAAFIIGLFLPGLSDMPKMTIPTLLALIIFLSCSRIHMDDFKSFRARDVLGIMVVRFMIIPFGMYWIGVTFLPEYKYALLLLGLVPCGATLSAVMGIVGGSAALGLSATTLTSLLAPFIIPVAFMLVSDVSVELDALGMFGTLSYMIFLPVVVYFALVRRFERVKITMRANASAWSCVLICGVILTAVGYQQETFFSEPALVLKTFLIGVVAYIFFYIFGWFFFWKGSLRQKMSYSLLSGNNNINLGISVAVLFMPAFESIVMVVWEFNWILGLTVFQIWIRRHKAKHEPCHAE